LYCGYCGRAMRGSMGKREYYYRDTTQIEKSGNCPQCTVRAEYIEGQVVDWLKRVFKQKLIDEEYIATGEQLERIQSRYNRAKDLYIAGHIDRDVYDAEKVRYESTIQPLHKNSNAAIITLLQEMRSKLTKWSKQSLLEKRRLLQIAAEAVYIQGSVLVGVQPTFALLPLTTTMDRAEMVGNSGPDEHGARVK